MSSARRSTKQVRQDRLHGPDNAAQQAERDAVIAYSNATLQEAIRRSQIDRVIERWDNGEIDNYTMAEAIAVLYAVKGLARL